MGSPDDPPADWFHDAVIYQVPTGLLRDTDGNGWGDLRGVAECLPYIRDLGADTIWLQPFYMSPYVDGGYDVVDHTEVSDRFGTLYDFKELMTRADELGIRVIVDLVVQHTSAGHPWFRQACKDPSSEYRDYYIWTDEPHDTVVKPVFPTVNESVWCWSEEAGQYYRHTFYAHEPDLNVGHPAVREEIHRIVRHWLDLGVAGFRVDAVPYVVVQAAQSDPRDEGFWIVEELRKTVKEAGDDVVLIAEADVDPEDYTDYFGDGDRFTMVLDFWLNNNLFLALAREEATPIARALGSSPTPPDDCCYAIWLRNHDELDLERLPDDEREETMAVFAPEPRMRAFERGIRRRLAPMLSDPRRLKLAMCLLCALPGTPVLLYGDEIGMGEDLDLPDRASVRTPMQWSGAPNAGFSDADPADLVHPVIADGPFAYEHVNVEEQQKHPDSLLQTLKHLLAVRREVGPFHSRTVNTVEVGHPSVLALHHTDGRAPVLMLANLSGDRVEVTLDDALADGLEEAVGDHAYDPPSGGLVHLHGYGYRWFRLTSSQPEP